MTFRCFGHSRSSESGPDGRVAVRQGLALSLCLLATLPAGTARAQGAGAVPMPPGQTVPRAPDALTAPPPAFQAVTADRIAQVLRIDPLAEVLATEISAAGDPTGTTGDPASDRGWPPIVARIVPVTRLRDGLRDGLAASVAGLDDPLSRAAVADALGFWASPLGQRTVALEHSARLALTDPEAEAAARAAFDAAAARDDPRIGQIRRLIDAADLVEPAVAASMNIAVASAQGLRDSGLFHATDADLAEDGWVQEPELRAEQAGWIESLLFLATGTLSDAEVERLIQFSATPGARRLNRMVDAAATAVFVSVARDLGNAAGLRQAGQPL